MFLRYPFASFLCLMAYSDAYMRMNTVKCVGQAFKFYLVASELDSCRALGLEVEAPSRRKNAHLRVCRADENGFVDSLSVSNYKDGAAGALPTIEREIAYIAMCHFLSSPFSRFILSFVP